MAAKSGGPDPDANPQLRLVMDKARAANMPKDNIKRALDKATGANGANYEEITYEGYGPAGVAILVHALTDNRNRTASAVRADFNRNGGNLGETGSVAFMFDRKGYMQCSKMLSMPVPMIFKLQKKSLKSIRILKPLKTFATNFKTNMILIRLKLRWFRKIRYRFRQTRLNSFNV